MTDGQPERRKDDRRVRKLIDDVASLTVAVAKIQESTSGLVEWFDNSSKAFHLFIRGMTALNWFIRKALGPLMFLAALVYAIAHGGRPPEWLKSWIDLFR